MSGSKYVPLALAACAVLGACDQPAAAPEYERVDHGALAVCATASEREYTFTAGVLGGAFAAPSVLMVVPPGALERSTTFTIRVPGTRHAEVEIRANGAHSFNFRRPVTIGIGYDRCAGLLPDRATVWHIDPATKTFLENMGGVHDALTAHIVFSTMHLSGYAIAN